MKNRGIKMKVYNPSRLVSLEEIGKMAGIDPTIVKKHLRSGRLIDQTEENVRDYIALLEMNKERYSSKDRYNGREQKRYHKWKIEDEIALSKLKNEEYIEFVAKNEQNKETTLEKTENENGKLP
jgi:hypothetical protein